MQNPLIIRSPIALAQACFLLLLLESHPLSAADSLPESVQQLPSHSPAEQLKKATLQWALATAQKSRDAEESRLLHQDIAAALHQNIGERQEPPPPFFPLLAGGTNNPFYASAMEVIEKSARAPLPDFQRKASGYYPYPILANDALHLVQGLCHPQSAFRGDPALIAPLLTDFQISYESLLTNPKCQADFGDCFKLAEMYWLLQSTYPGLILPSRKAQWERALRINSDKILQLHGARYHALTPLTAYLNADIYYIAALGTADLIFHNESYRRAAEDGLKLMDLSLYPDGGFAYIDAQNECFTYHTANISGIARLGQLTGNPLARDLLVRTKNYYRLSIEPSLCAEYSTAPCWKHYWNAITGSDQALIVASLTGDPLNAKVGLPPAGKRDLWIASFYQPDLTPAPAWPDRYFVYDRNIQGPRTRFGSFSTCGTTRNYLQDVRGKSTYVGCLDSTEKQVFLGALQDAATAVYTQKPQPGKSDGIFALASEEENTSTVTPDFAAVSTRHVLSRYKGGKIPFAGRQTWLFLPDRLIGLVEVESLTNQDNYGVCGQLNLLVGRGEFRKNEPVVAARILSPKTVQYGSLTLDFHDLDYRGFATEYFMVFGDYVPGTTTKSQRLLLLDPGSTGDRPGTKIHYTTGETHFYLVEIRSRAATTPAQVVRLKAAPGLIGFDACVAGTTYRLLFNGSRQTQNVSPLFTGHESWEPHADGEQYRPAWLEEKAADSGVRPGKTELEKTFDLAPGAQRIWTQAH